MRRHDAELASAQANTDAQRIALQHAGRRSSSQTTRKVVIATAGDTMIIFGLTRRVGRQAIGLNFVNAAAKKTLSGYALVLEPFAHAQQHALGKARPSVVRSAL